jgi:hypothetical protein
VGHADGVYPEGARLDRVSRRKDPQVGGHAAVGEPLASEAQGEAASVHGRGCFLQREGERSDVVLMTVGEDDGAQLGAPLAQIVEVGHDRLDARHLGAWKRESGIHEQEVLVPLHDHRVQPELSQSSEGDQANSALVVHQPHTFLWPMARPQGPPVRLRGTLPDGRTPQQIASRRVLTP